MEPRQHNIYLPGYQPSQVSHHEWRTAENSAGHLLPELVKMRETKPRLTLLDVGAGSGTISLGLAKYIPDGEVIATDLSDAILERAKGFADSAGVRNIRFQTADAYRLPFEDSAFDVAHCHQMLCHMDAPSDALREMLRVTRPGGLVAAREADLEMTCVWPELSGVTRYQELLNSMMEAVGGSRKAGRQLVSWALQAGAQRDQIAAGYGSWCYSAPADRSVWAKASTERIRHGEMRKKAIELGMIQDEDVEEMASAWEEWAKRDDASVGMLHGEIVIHK